MPVKDPQRARQIVTERLRRFFATLREEFVEGVDQLWKRVETKLSGTPPDRAAEDQKRE